MPTETELRLQSSPSLHHIVHAGLASDLGSPTSSSDVPFQPTPTSVQIVDFDDKTCFVCNEGGDDLLQLCNCKNMWLHLDCQRKLIERTAAHRTGCPVCKTPYSNIKMAALKRKLTREGHRMVWYFAGVCIVIFISIYEFVMYMKEQLLAFLVLSILFFVLASTFGALGFMVFRRQTMYTSEVATVQVNYPCSQPTPPFGVDADSSQLALQSSGLNVRNQPEPPADNVFEITHV